MVARGSIAPEDSGVALHETETATRSSGRGTLLGFVGLFLTAASMVGLHLSIVRASVPLVMGVAMVALSATLAGLWWGLGSALLAVAIHALLAGPSLDLLTLAAAGASSVIAALLSVRFKRLATIEESARTEQLYGLIDGVEAVIFKATAPPFKFSYVSGGVVRITGKLPSAFIDDPEAWVGSIHPDDRALFRAWASDIQDRPGTSSIEYRVLRDSEIVWLSQSVRVGKKRRGKATITGHLVEITGERSAIHRLAAVLAASKVLNESPEPDDLPIHILGSVCSELDWQFGSFWRPDGDKLRCVTTWHDGSEESRRFAEATLRATLDKGEGLPGGVWAQRKPKWIPDVTSDSSFTRAEAAAEAGMKGAFGFPVFVGDELYGVFEFLSSRIHRPDSDLMQMMEAIGHQTGHYIARREAERELTFQKTLLESQNEGTIDGTLVLSPDGRVLSVNRRFLELWKIPEQLLEGGREPEMVKSIIDQLAEPDEGLETLQKLSSDLEREARGTVELKDGRVFDMWSPVLRAPEGGAYGRAWYFRDITDATRQQRALEESRNRLRFLAEAGRILSASLDQEETLSSIARLCVPRLADWCAVDLVRENGIPERVAVQHVDPEKIKWAMELNERYPPSSDSPHGAVNVIRTGESELYPRLPDQVLETVARDQEHLQILRSLKVRSVMVVPLVSKGRTLGAMTFVSSDSEREYTPEDLALAEALARRAALAIDNARLYQERSYIAKTLQDSLLPPDLPEVQGLELAAIYRASGEANEVGGDFYDLFRYGTDRWALVLGDVSGKGAEAAALTALARYTVRAEAMQESEPTRVIRMLNDAIISQSKHETFCTAVYMRLEPTSEGLHVTAVCAGHPAPIVIRSDGELQRFQRRSMALGIESAIDPRDELVQLRPGDTLLAFTDGLIEAGNDSELFGEERVREIAGMYAELGPQALLEALTEAALTFSGGALRDDLAMIALRVEQV